MTAVNGSVAAQASGSTLARAGASASAPVMEAPLARARVAALAEGEPGAAGVTIEVPGVVGLLTVRADSGKVPLSKVFGSVLGLEVPERLSTTSSDERRVRWMSPDEWLVSCPLEELAALESSLRDALAGERHVSVTDVSGGWCVFVLGGPCVRDVLAKCVTIDLDPRAFDTGRVASTVFAKSGATIANLGGGRYEIVCRRSFADYVLRFVANASREYGLALID